MVKISVKLPLELEFEEFKKQICFISSDILSFEVVNNFLVVSCKDDANTEQLEEKIEKAIKNVLSNKVSDVVVSNYLYNTYGYTVDFLEDGTVVEINDGLVSLGNNAVVLYEYFDEVFKNIALKYGAVEERYPVLLGIDTMNNTGYFRRTPQYSMFCSNLTEDVEQLELLKNENFCENSIEEVLEKPSFTLSPSACFHVYEKYKNRILNQNTIITLNQSVFRNEGRLNWYEFGRLRDYHVREIVFFGDDSYVECMRKNILEETKKVLKDLKLNSNVTVASDPFIMPKMIRFKKIQMMQRSKYEVRVSYGENETLAVASFNLHGTAFTEPFHIGVNGVENVVSGCVGFGIERWVMCFLAQYGSDLATWPEKVRKFKENRENE